MKGQVYDRNPFVISRSNTFKACSDALSEIAILKVFPFDFNATVLFSISSRNGVWFLLKPSCLQEYISSHSVE